MKSMMDALRMVWIISRNYKDEKMGEAPPRPAPRPPAPPHKHKKMGEQTTRAEEEEGPQPPPLCPRRAHEADLVLYCVQGG